MADTVWASGLWASGFWSDGVWSSDTPDFWSDDFWGVGFWADGFWAPIVVPPVPVVSNEPAGGGRRIYDPDDHTTKTRPFTKKERDEWDKWFGERVAPRYVAPVEQPVVTKRVDPPKPLVIASLEPVRTPQDRITAAKHFTALDSIEALLDRFEYQPDAQQRVRDYQAALANAEQQRQAMELVAVQRARLEAERQEQARLAWEFAEQQRMDAERQQAEEDEMISVLLAIHEAE